MKCWVAWEAGRRFAEDGRGGALELLLVTPLSERAILAGWLTGLKRRFAGPVAMLLSLDFLLWWAGADGGWLLAMLVATGLFIADCYTLCWVGLWKGLTARSSTRAYVETLSRVLVLPWLTFFGAVGISGLVFDLTDLPSAFGWLVFLWFVIGYVLDFAFCLWSIHKLSQDLRLVAAQQFEPRLREYAEYFRRNYNGKFQLVVVLNGCRDDTLGVVNRVARDFPEISALNFPDPIGKGGALIEGLKLAPNTDLIGYVDADGATGPQAFLELVHLTAQADCVIGSRWLPGAVLHQSQPWLRRFFSRVFHAIVRVLFWSMNIADTQCPAKVMRRAAVEKIHSALRIADLAFDVNLLYSLKREKLRILEVPTEWTDKSR